MTNMDHPYRLIHDYKQHSIGSAIAGAKQHLTDWHVEVRAFGRERTAFGKMGKRFDTRARAHAPLSGGSGSTVPNVTIYLSKISFGFRRDLDAIT